MLGWFMGGGVHDFTGIYMRSSFNEMILWRITLQVDSSKLHANEKADGLSI